MLKRKKTETKYNIKKFLKGESERKTISKMFSSHERDDMTGSQISPEG